MRICIRPATEADLPRVSEVRHGTAENRLTDPSRVADAEVAWYLREAIFLVSEDEEGLQGFVCANHQTGYVWALFVIDGAQVRGHGTALLDEAIARFRSRAPSGVSHDRQGHHSGRVLPRQWLAGTMCNFEFKPAFVRPMQRGESPVEQTGCCSMNLKMSAVDHQPIRRSALGRKVG
jgi:hypothetical protein